MRVGATWREAWRNTVSGTSRSGLYALLFASLVGGLAGIDIYQTQRLVHEAVQFQKAGASVSILAAPGQIDPAACDALNEVAGIRAAGAIRAEEKRVTLSLLPAAPVPVSTVTARFPRVLDATLLPSPGVVLSDLIVRDLGSAPGAAIDTDDGKLPVAGVYSYPLDGRKSGYGYMILMPSNDPAPFDECWADIWPHSESRRALLYTALTMTSGGDGAQPALSQLNSTLGVAFDGSARFADRVTRFMALVGALLGVLVGYLWLRSRRLELASNLHAGMTRGDLRRTLEIELFLWVTPGCLIALSIVSAVILADPAAGISSMATLAARVAFATSCGVACGSLIAWLQTRERHLFRYFKDR